MLLEKMRSTTSPNETEPAGTPCGGNRKRKTLWGHVKAALAGKHALAILDQAVVSGTRFGTVIIVGRACGPHELGDYMLGFTLYNLAACIQAGLISLPFTIYGNYVHGEERREYSGSVLAHAALFGLLIMIGFGLAAGALGLGLGRSEFTTLTAMLAIAFPLALVVEFARRFELARLELKTAAAVDVAMSAIQVPSLLLLAWQGHLSATAAFAAIGLAGGIAGLGWLWHVRELFVIRSRRLLADALRNWKFGRWSLASQLLLAARSTAMVWLLALMLDPTSTGVFVGCDTLMRLSAPLLLAVANILFPSAARAFARGDMPEVRRLARQTAIVLGTITALMCGLSIRFGDAAVAVLYGRAFGVQGAVICLLALGMVADGLEIVATNSLLALDRSDVNFIANLVGTALTLALALLLVPAWGIVGAAWGSLLGRCVTSIVLWLAFLRLARAEAGGK